jgi:glycosyltransferase involved in cell wall biosynthesis
MPNPIRVLHVYSGNLYGGVERMLFTLASLRDGVPGMRQGFALCFESELSREIELTGCPLYLLGEVRLSRPLSVRRARARLREALETERPDVVLCHSSWSQAVFGPVVRARGIPLVFWLHDAVTGTTLVDRMARRTRPDFAVCTSRFAGGTLGRLWAHLPSTVVYPPVWPMDAGSLDRSGVRAELDTPDGDVVLLQASRMEPWKGHRLLIQALGQLADKGGWTCWIAGGAQRPHEEAHLAEMYALARQMGIAHRIRFLGHRGDVRTLMAAADVLCQPNLGPEPFGIAYVEGMYAGIPVVATAIGGAAEIVDASCGILVPPDAPAALAGALRGLIADPALRARLGAAGPAHAHALCDHHRQAERLRDAMVEVVANSRG